ncbi:MAG: two-component system response regulator [Rhodocyclales bacterium]|nr:two-component system response regulator [Rhodocyclales bacterium]
MNIPIDFTRCDPSSSDDAVKGSLILIVDDVPANLAVLGDLLHGAGYQVKAATSGRAALRYATQDPQPALILLDVMMPEMDGYQVLATLRKDPATITIPVIFLTALDNARDEERGFQHGAADYIAKPIKPDVVLARVRNQLLARIATNWLRDQNAALEAEVARRMEENELIQAASIRALAHLAETRDPETGNHILRTQGYVRLLAIKLQHHECFAETLTDGYIKMLADSAPLHDIGKVGIPDSILQKPGKLTPEEWEIMKTHSRLGSDAIEQAERDIAHPVEFLALAKEVAHWHHERWDGRGYPDGLIAESIPISARLMTIADVFDALISKRVYKDPMPIDKVREIIVGERGKQFDPDVTDIFLACFSEFAAIAEQHSDG